MSTLTSLRSALHSRKGDWPAICSATGLSYWWLTKFAQGRIRDPGLSKVEKLQVYLAALSLPAANDDAGTDPADVASAVSPALEAQGGA